MKKRVFILNIVVFICFSAVILRLIDIMIFKHDRFAKSVMRQTTEREDIQVRRGVIFDRMGRRLAGNLEYNSIYCYKNKIKDNPKAINAICRIADIKYSKLNSILKGSNNYVLLKRKVPDNVLEGLDKVDSKAFDVIPDAKRYYPSGDFASHVLGFVDVDNKGREGIEAAYNEYLINKGGTIYVNRDARGNRFYNSEIKERIGNNIVLSIDQTLQYIAETELDHAMEEWKAEAATVIMMDPYNGEIMAMATKPSYNPNIPGKFNPSARRNRAITDMYEPGSTFKIVTATAALEEHVVNLNEIFDVSSGSIIVGGKKIKDDHRHGRLKFQEIIEKSSNVGTIMLALRLGKNRVYKYMTKYGFGTQTGIDLQGEVTGRIRPPSKWSAVSIGAAAIGQEVGVTPLQMLTAYSIVANGGYPVSPHIVRSMVTPEGKTLKVKVAIMNKDGSRVEQNNHEPIISERTVKILKDALIMVTSEGGTAKFATVDGNTVAGKTGTAQMVNPRTGLYSKTDYISSFVGFVPASKPAFSMIVVVWKPRGEIYGGLVAAPIFRAIAEKSLSYLNIPREDLTEKNLLLMTSTK